MKEKLNINKNTIFVVMVAAYCVFTVCQNIFEMKTIGTEAFAFGGGGIMFSWATFMITDILTEVYGEKKTMWCYTMAGILNLIVVGLAQILIAMPGVYEDQNVAFAQIMSNGIRTVLASFIAFWFGNFVNMKVMVGMKKIAGDKYPKWLLFVRAVLSTIAGQFIDNALFATIAFAPIGLSVFEMEWKDILTSSLFGVACETLVESIFVPFITIPLSRKLEKMD